MFEGTVADPSSTDRLVLNTGTGESDYIDTGTYHILSLAAKAERTLDMYLYWVNTDNDTGYVDTGEDLTTDWQTIGPIDIDSLSSRWDDYDVRTVWLEFGAATNFETDVRIGWIRLTE